jgi:hypothetical protein
MNSSSNIYEKYIDDSDVEEKEDKMADLHEKGNISFLDGDTTDEEYEDVEDDISDDEDEEEDDIKDGISDDEEEAYYLTEEEDNISVLSYESNVSVPMPKKTYSKTRKTRIKTGTHDTLDDYIRSLTEGVQLGSEKYNNLYTYEDTHDECGGCGVKHVKKKLLNQCSYCTLVFPKSVLPVDTGVCMHCSCYINYKDISSFEYEAYVNTCASNHKIESCSRSSINCHLCDSIKISKIKQKKPTATPAIKKKPVMVIHI